MSTGKHKLFVYGSLKRGEGFGHFLKELKAIKAKALGHVERGEWYPKLYEGDEIVEGELYEVDDNLLKALDEVEGFLPADASNSLYIRKEIVLIEPAGAAWAYFFNG